LPHRAYSLGAALTHSHEVTLQVTFDAGSLAQHRRQQRTNRRLEELLREEIEHEEQEPGHAARGVVRLCDSSVKPASHGRGLTRWAGGNTFVTPLVLLQKTAVFLAFLILVTLVTLKIEYILYS